MGSMFRLTYDVTLKDPAREKELIETHRQLLESIRQKDDNSLSEKVRSSYFEEQLSDQD